MIFWRSRDARQPAAALEELHRSRHVKLDVLKLLLACGARGKRYEAPRSAWDTHMADLMPFTPFDVDGDHSRQAQRTGGGPVRETNPSGRYPFYYGNNLYSINHGTA